jgi:hypothetical protein
MATVTVMASNVYDSVLDERTHQALLTYIGNLKWKRGWSSTDKFPYTHFNASLYDLGRTNRQDVTASLRDPILGTWRGIQMKLGLAEYKVLRCYANLYEYAIEGYPHTDAAPEFADDLTLILYCCDEWRVSWMGETVLIENGEVIRSVLPRPNRLFAFPSSMLHAARSVTRACQCPRITLMFKVAPCLTM